MTILIPYINSPLNELRYALRSICCNQQHDNVVICGDVPSWYKGAYVCKKNTAKTKQMNVYENICAGLIFEGMVSEDFILWYDDLYKIKPEPLVNTNLGTLKDALKMNFHLSTKIGIENVLKLYPQGLFFGNHRPMIINGKKFREMNVKPLYNIKSLYGNYAGITGEFADDVKERNERNIKLNGQTYLCTHNITRHTINLLDKLFPEKCKYEKGN